MKKVIPILVVIMLGAFGAVFFMKTHKQDNKPTIDPPVIVTPEPKKDPDVKPPSPPEVMASFTVYKEALAASKTKQRPMFLYFGAEWCVYCKKMKSTTLADQDVKDKLSKEYVVCFIDTDKDRPTARQYKVRGIPAYMVVGSDEKVLLSATGVKAKTEFMSWLSPKEVSLIDP